MSPADRDTARAQQISRELLAQPRPESGGTMMQDEQLDLWLRAWMKRGGWNIRWFGLFQSFARELRTAITQPAPERREEQP